MKYTFLVPFFLLAPLCLGAQEKLYPNEFPAGDVKLLDSLFRPARDLNIKVLLEYNTDRLLAPYRKEAGLPVKAESYPNWEGLDGHIGGHYLSALAMNFAATGNAECGKRLAYMISELKACQEANTRNHTGWGQGYAGGVPDSKKIWTALMQGDLGPYRSAWVPWYNLHKIYAGLRDAWLYTGNTEARDIFLKFCDWGIRVISSLDEEQMQAMLDTEHGGMNEIFADAYQLTGQAAYLNAARRFSHRQLLLPMASLQDNLDNKHANTQVPKAIGFARIGELAHDSLYERAAEFFWETVTHNRSLAFGGNSRREFFPSKEACADFLTDVEGPESCNSYNMLKLTEDLFRIRPEAAYMDYYERTLYNHILSTQDPVTGGYVYFTPVRPQSYRVYSAPGKAMWCCVGSGMENHGKYNELIYTRRADTLYLNLFIPSVLNWKEKKLILRQENRFPDKENTRLVISEGHADFTLMVRYPGWVAEGKLHITVNGAAVPVNQAPSSYVAVSRKWKKGDIIQISLPMQNRLEALPGMPDYVAFLHGPVVLAARTGTGDMKGLIAGDSRWGHIPSGKRFPVSDSPVLLNGDQTGPLQQLIPVKNNPLHYILPATGLQTAGSLELEPFFRINRSRYTMYWKMLTRSGYRDYQDSLARKEQLRLDILNRTVDFVTPGEQQPEADHRAESKNSRTGNNGGLFWRDASDGGFFSYLMETHDQADLVLRVKYWGAEWGSRKFDLYIDDKKLVTEDNTGRWNQSAFFEIEYPVPAGMLAGKKQVRVKCIAHPGSTAGAVYDIRLVRKN